MARQYGVDDSKWDEVRIINGYAMFMGYLMMGVRGLGLLVVTWTTVVLLGGFVSDLQKKDFWCLTGITLIQTAEVFNFLLKEKLTDMEHSSGGLVSSAFITLQGLSQETKGLVLVLVVAYLIAGIIMQVLVFVIILLPLGVLYVLGLYISTGVSLWRLIEHDFGNEGGANQKPALQVLYSLAVAQGVLFGYKTIHALGATNRLAKMILHGVMMVEDELVLTEYLEETVAGCEKDPSFANGRNLVTYGVDLMMEAKSNDGFIAGIRVLGGAINDNSSDGRGRKVLANHLLTRSDSSSHMIHRLLETVGPRSAYSSEVRTRAARIVALVARGIRLRQFPGMIECMSSMLQECLCEEYPNLQDTQTDRISRNFGDMKLKLCSKVELLEICNKLNNYERVEQLEEYELDYQMYDRGSPDSPDFSLSDLIQRLVQCLVCKRKITTEADRKESRRRPKNTVHGFDRLLTETMNIILQLAVDEDNGRIMSNTVPLHKIVMAPLKLHRDNHDLCRARANFHKSELQLLETCWVLVTEWHAGVAEEESSSQGRSTLVNATVNNIKSTIKGIFDCLDCGATQKMQAIQILLHLSWDDDMSFIMDSESSTRRLTWILLLAYCYLFGHKSERYRDWMVSGRFTNRKKDLFRIHLLAGEKLSDMLGKKHELPSEESERELQLIRLAVEDLTSAFADDAQDISIRTHAAIVMEGLIWHCNISGAEGILLGVVPKVVKEMIFRCGSTIEERQAQATDVEEGGVGVSQDEERLRKALVCLCLYGYMLDDKLRPQFKKIASETCKEQGKSFDYFKSLLVL